MFFQWIRPNAGHLRLPPGPLGSKRGGPNAHLKPTFVEQPADLVPNGTRLFQEFRPSFNRTVITAYGCFGAAGQHEDLPGDTRPIGRMSAPGQILGTQRAGAIPSEGAVGFGRSPAGGFSVDLAHDCHFLALCGHDGRRPGTVPVWRPGTALPI
jgi:hypothetical protein